jgi:hypothetical protein
MERCLWVTIHLFNSRLYQHSITTLSVDRHSGILPSHISRSSNCFWWPGLNKSIAEFVPFPNARGSQHTTLCIVYGRRPRPHGCIWDSFFFDLKFEKCSDRRPVRASYVMGFWYFVLVVAASTSNSTASAWSGRPGPRLALSYVRVRARI